MGLFIPPTYGFPPPPPWPASSNPLARAFAVATPSRPVYPWAYVRRRFSKVLANLEITDRQREDGERKQAGIRGCLNRHYWGHPSETANGLLIGSWGKLTRIRPPPDVDLLFLLPPAVYHRFQQRDGNRQSQLLQEVKTVLAARYKQTMIRGDRQVVVVPFDTTAIEVVPGFRCADGSIIICDAKGGGRYKACSAEAEATDLMASDAIWAGNTRALARIIKQWQRERNVPLKPFQIERLAIEFLDVWPYSQHDAFWYDWMIHDFLACLVARANGAICMPGTGEVIRLGSDWLSRAQTAHRHALLACDYEYQNYESLAGIEWQAILGSAAPILVR